MKDPVQASEPAKPFAQRSPKKVVGKLPGMRDVDGGSLFVRQEVQNSLVRILALRGYDLVETPLLEPTEIFLRKSGGELASRMYTFLEPGGRRASLRPEFTSAIIRHYLEKIQYQGSDQPLRPPVRLQYAGPVFRYDHDNLNVPREFVQVGAELIGASGPRAEGEIVALSCEPLRSQGLDGIQLIIGHLGVIHALLKEFQLSERALLFLMESLTDLREGKPGFQRVQNRAKRLKLYSGDSLSENFLELEQIIPDAPVGVRTRDDIIARLRRKQQAGEVSDGLEVALEFVAKIAQIRGPSQKALRDVKTLVEKFGLTLDALKPLEATLQTLELHQLNEIEVILDLGLAPGIAYYTGMVFDVRAASPSGNISVGAGGRYDGLARALGAEGEVPALGFAWNLDRILAGLGSCPSTVTPPQRVLVISANATVYGQALMKAASLRLEGYQAELLLEENTRIDVKDYARTRGLKNIVTVDENGTVRNTTL
jgi:histidyl-tRNA synthetase